VGCGSEKKLFLNKDALTLALQMKKSVQVALPASIPRVLFGAFKTLLHHLRGDSRSFVNEMKDEARRKISFVC